MTIHKNIIRKQIVNFRIDGNLNDIAIQQEVAGWCRDFLIPSIELVLEDDHQTDEVVFIDKISLDIDLGRTKNWKTGLIEKITLQFKEKLLSKIGSNPGDVKVKSKSASFSEALAYFLKHGILPWYSNIKTRHDFDIETGEWLKNSSSEEIKNLMINLRDEKSVKRFVRLLKERDFETLIAAAAGVSKENISSVFENVKVITNFISGEKILQQRILNDFNELLVSGFAEKQAVNFPEKAFTEWLNITEKTHPFDLQKIDTDLIIGAGARNIIRQMQNELNLKSKNIPWNIIDKPGNIPADIIVKAAIIGSEPDNELREGVFITNAGAVIIAPFLNALFSRTRLLDENIITDHPTAISLLHYCITGNINPVEFELLLLKILCGIDPEIRIDTEILMDEAMVNEADKMLSAIIEYWEILRDTSINGLREAFLQRNGKLSFIKDEWLLQVESKSYDMLLDQLPWGIGMIKLPWMMQMLRVEWR